MVKDVLFRFEFLLWIKGVGSNGTACNLLFSWSILIIVFCLRWNTVDERNPPVIRTFLCEAWWKMIGPSTIHPDIQVGGFKCFFNFHPYFGKWSKLTNIFEMGGSTIHPDIQVGGFKCFFNFHPYFGKWSKLTNIFEMGGSTIHPDIQVGGFKCFLIFTPISGNDPNWQIFLRWVAQPSIQIYRFKVRKCWLQEPSMRRRLKSFQKTLTPSDWGRRIGSQSLSFFWRCFLLEFFLSPTPKRKLLLFFKIHFIFLKTFDRNQVGNFSSGLIFFDLQKPYILRPLKKKLSKDP